MRMRRPRHPSRTTRCIHILVACSISMSWTAHVGSASSASASSTTTSGPSSPPPPPDGEANRRLQERREASAAVRRWRLEQGQYYSLRSTFLTETLASRGVPLPTMASVSTVEGDRPESDVDWDCALSTESDPKTCLYSFDAQVGTKVVAPAGTDQWISLGALNRLRRTDPTKVEGMWHHKYLILKSWFGEGGTSLLQHVGVRGWIVSAVLLDSRATLRLLLAGGVLSAAFLLMPIWDYLLNSFLVSALFWRYYPNWSRIAHAALPLKLLLAQMAWKFASSRLDRLERVVRDAVVDAECRILEETVPVTVGEGAEEEEEDDEEERTEHEFEDGSLMSVTSEEDVGDYAEQYAVTTDEDGDGAYEQGYDDDFSEDSE